MAFQSVPNTAEIVIQYLGNTINSVNVLQAEHSGGYDLADLQELADAVDVAVDAKWLPHQVDDQTYVQTVVRGLQFVNDEEAVADANSGTGGLAEVGLPGNATFSIKKGSGLTGRSARGRMYWIGLSASALQANENLLKVVDADAIEEAVEEMRVAINATSWTAVILSRVFNGAPRTTGAIFQWTTTSAVNVNVDSQRRRLQP